LHLQDRLSIRGLLRRKNVPLELYTYELCLLQREGKLRHLFFFKKTVGYRLDYRCRLG
jgi:hypothetical protein